MFPFPMFRCSPVSPVFFARGEMPPPIKGAAGGFPLPAIGSLSAVSLDDVNEYLKKRAPGAMTLVFLGSKALKIDENRVPGQH